MTTDSPERIWPDRLKLRDTGLHDDMGGGGQRIYTTAGRGYERVEYVRADLCRPDRSPAGEVRHALDELLDLTACRCGPEYSDRRLHHPECNHAARVSVEKIQIALSLAPAPEREGLLLEALRFYRDAWEDDVDQEFSADGSSTGSLGERYPSVAMQEDGGEKARAALAAYEESQR